MISKEQQNINIALMRCIMENHKTYTVIAEAVFTNNPGAKDSYDKFSKAAEGYLSAIERCISLMEESTK